MWRDICLANRVALLDALDGFQADLDLLRKLVDVADADGLLEVFARAKAARDGFLG